MCKIDIVGDESQQELLHNIFKCDNQGFLFQEKLCSVSRQTKWSTSQVAATMPYVCSIGNNLPSNNNNSTNLEVADTKCSKLRQAESAMSLCSSEAEGRCGAGHTTSHVKIVSSTSTTIALTIVLGSGLENTYTHVRQLLCFPLLHTCVTIMNFELAAMDSNL